jgi:hypothetical protein
MYLICFRFSLYTVYNLDYKATTLGYKVEEKLCLGVREQKGLNTTGLGSTAVKFTRVLWASPA